MIYTETVTQEILVRFADGDIKAAMITEQDLYIEDESGDIIGRSASKFRDMDAEALKGLVAFLDHDHVPYVNPLDTK